MKKGFALEDERLKNLGGGNYFDENVSEFVEDKVELDTLLRKYLLKEERIELFFMINVTIQNPFE